MSRYNVEQILNLANPVMPVLAISELDHAVPLARALAEGGLKVLEITLRTAVAMDVIALLKQQVPEVIVGAGTVTSVAQLEALDRIGCDFAISPGTTDALLCAGKEVSMPYLPAIATPSELMLGLQHGYRHFKFFPAETYGGVKTLKAMAGPFADIRFCPTGGISESNFEDYLKLPNVMCVGGSWVAPTAMVEAHEWSEITRLAQQAVAKTKR
ncbi:bifunctional 4-hydroxy-2-oxoglutarate aldolase/2-dehydro-3-deoxy-phosphogluconate aldolase [Gynuella sunshinyii]|uniref:2-dehydro-3-deoxy-phosphogluconate aldolase n=1 Tax=Gynuella sunshinyii YC6258 TaxID=1445510 RepID=A0A0C5V674_9GAMM|nr:bifunctional 4-hydroxy-2-oxoglutarate aldolase/2-dehydro-3-deoxy-phosphogluconate aldolase [Gynuella sunshinyii]AJQ94965.1 2-keto-3-deoxy-6-phosphogluconate aldolase [Gynuella sunshinyii YC6258]